MNFLSNRDKLYYIFYMQSRKNVAKVLKLFYILILYGFLVPVAAQDVGFPLKCEDVDDCPNHFLLEKIGLIYLCMDNFCIYRDIFHSRTK
uniref:Nodule-specific cysteine-rich peptide L32 n=1 Tax=Lens culinaris TaxID=3864 RepID=A0A7T8IG14_LENCU|nr:nodule-specific cysteine-rich peptide L32 [Lens culinaris]